MPEKSIEFMIDRRTFLTSFAASLALQAGGGLLAGRSLATEVDPAEMQLSTHVPFSRTSLLNQARALAANDYIEPPKIPQDWIDLTYDQYRGINFKPESGLWNGTDRPFEMEFFAPGLYFPSPISVSVVDGDAAQEVMFSRSVFKYAHVVPELSEDDSLGYSGFRIRSAINDPETFGS